MPTWSPPEVLALRERLGLDKDPEKEETIVAFVVSAARVGGLSYLLVKLMDALTANARAGRPPAAAKSISRA